MHRGRQFTTPTPESASRQKKKKGNSRDDKKRDFVVSFNAGTNVRMFVV